MKKIPLAFLVASLVMLGSKSFADDAPQASGDDQPASTQPESAPDQSQAPDEAPAPQQAPAVDPGPVTDSLPYRQAVQAQTDPDAAFDGAKPGDQGSDQSGQ